MNPTTGFFSTGNNLYIVITVYEGLLTLRYLYVYQCDKLSELEIKCAFISDDDGSGTMDIFGHARAVKFFEENNIAGKFFSFVNGEGVILILFNPLMY